VGIKTLIHLNLKKKSLSFPNNCIYSGKLTF